MYESSQRVTSGSISSAGSTIKSHPRSAMDCVRRMEETLDRGGKVFEELKARLDPVLANHPAPDLRLEKDGGEVPIDSVLIQQMNNQAARWENFLRDLEALSERIQVQ